MQTIYELGPGAKYAQLRRLGGDFDNTLLNILRASVYIDDQMGVFLTDFVDEDAALPQVTDYAPHQRHQVDSVCL